MHIRQVPEWDRDVLLRSPLFVPLHPVIVELPADRFPSLQDCNALLAKRQSPITVQSGMPLCFVAHQSGKLKLEDQYEPRCYLRGEVATRPYNWHDLLNALVWLTFPKTKASINARHYDVLAKQEIAASGSQRGTVRDVNTLIDESGVIVPYADTGLAGMLRGFKWKELFWQHRELVRAQSTQQAMGFNIFGHGLYEKTLQPYIGMTGQGLLLEVGLEYFGWPLERQLAHMDNLLADYLADPEHCRSTRDLFPVPLLGVPEWDSDNGSETYYDNTAYFRPGRRK